METEDGPRVVYDLERDEAFFGRALVQGQAIVWEIEAEPDWIVRCDRVDFPPGGIAYRHVHPGPGIRRILHGELTIDRDGSAQTYRAGESWLEGGERPRRRHGIGGAETAFVRVLLLPREWAGRRTIRYVDPADEAKPKLQRVTVLLEKPL